MNYVKYLRDALLKYFLYYPIFVFAVGLLIGTVIFIPSISFRGVEYLWLVLVLVVFLIFIVSSISWKKALLLFFLSILLGLGIVYNRTALYNLHSLQAANCGDNHVADVTANLEDVYYKEGSTIITLKPSMIENWSYAGKILATVDGIYDLYPGQKLRLNLFLERPENFSPDFDYVKYLYRKDIHLLAKVDSFEIIGSYNKIYYKLNSFRSSLISKSKTIFSEPENSLLLGLTLGYRAEFDSGFDAALRKTGTTHIVAISGSNVVLMISFLAPLLAYFNPKMRLFFISGFLLLLCLFTGCSAPVIRASLVIVFVLLTNLLGREIPPIVGLCFAFIAMIFVNPFYLWDVSFELSFLSSLGLMFGSNVFKFDVEDKNFKVFDSLFEILKSTFSVFLFTLPITVYYFGEFSILSFISNLFVLPITEMSTLLGLLNMLFVSISINVAKILSYLTYIPLNFIQRIIFLISKLPIGLVPVSFKISPIIICIYWLVLGLVIGYINYRKNISDVENGEI